jgi:hypothetical protein
MLENKNIYHPSQYILGFLFALFYVSDFISKINENQLRNTSLYLKLIFGIIIIFYVLKEKNEIGFKIFKHIFLLFTVFIIGQLIIKAPFFLDRVENNFKIFTWYIYIFLLYAAYNTYSNRSNNINNSKQILFFCFESIFVLNTILIFVGWLFNICPFKSYYLTERFGYNGLIRNATHASYIYIIFTTYFYYKSTIEKGIKNHIYLFISIFSSFFIGTKACFVFLFFIFFYHLNKMNIWFKILIPFLFLVFSEKIKITLIFLLKKNQFMYNVYLKKGLWTMLFSTRDLSINSYLIPYIKNKWRLLNFFFGGAEFDKHRTEFELIDLFWFFGIIGIIFYFFIFNKYAFNIYKLYNYPLVIFILMTSLLAGSFFSSVSVMTYFFILLIYLKEQKT